MMANNVLHVFIVSLPNNSLISRCDGLVSLEVPRALRKLSLCECADFASHQSSSLGVHPFISFTRTCDFDGGIFLH